MKATSCLSRAACQKTNDEQELQRLAAQTPDNLPEAFERFFSKLAKCIWAHKREDVHLYDYPLFWTLCELQNIIDENAAVRLDAYADIGSGREAVSSSVFAEVLAASTGGASGVRLDVRDYGEIDAAEVVKFRK